MKTLNPAANAVMRLAIGVSGALNLAFVGFHLALLEDQLPALPWAFVALQIGNGLLVAGLSFACVWLMGKA